MTYNYDQTIEFANENGIELCSRKIILKQLCLQTKMTERLCSRK